MSATRGRLGRAPGIVVHQSSRRAAPKDAIGPGDAEPNKRDGLAPMPGTGLPVVKLGSWA